MFITATIPIDGHGDPDPVRHLVHAEHREREALHVDTEPGGDRRGKELPAELLPPRQQAEIVDRAHRRRDCCAEHDPLHRTAQREERDRRDDHAEEHRQPAEPRYRRAVALAFRTAVDEAQVTGGRADRRREQQDDHERGRGSVEHFEVVGQLAPDHRALLRPVEPISRVAEARDDVALLVQAAVDRGDDDLHVRMAALDVLDPLAARR